MTKIIKLPFDLTYVTDFERAWDINDKKRIPDMDLLEALLEERDLHAGSPAEWHCLEVYLGMMEKHAELREPNMFRRFLYDYMKPYIAPDERNNYMHIEGMTSHLNDDLTPKGSRWFTHAIASSKTTEEEILSTLHSDEEDSHYSTYDSYDCHTSLQVCCAIIMHYCRMKNSNGTRYTIKRCIECNRFFVATNKKEVCCNRVNKQGLTCKEVHDIKSKALSKDDEVNKLRHKIHTRFITNIESAKSVESAWNCKGREENLQELNAQFDMEYSNRRDALRCVNAEDYKKERDKFVLWLERLSKEALKPPKQKELFDEWAANVSLVIRGKKKRRKTTT